MEAGVVYPGDVEVSVELSPGPTICSDVSDNSCTVKVPRGVYNITLNQTNEVGSTLDRLDLIDCEHS